MTPVILMAMVILTVTVTLALKARRAPPVSPAPVVLLFGGFAILCTLGVGLYVQASAQRDQDVCLLQVQGTQGDRHMWQWLFGELEPAASGNDELAGTKQRGEAELEANLPALDPADCPDGATTTSPTTP